MFSLSCLRRLPRPCGNPFHAPTWHFLLESENHVSRRMWTVTTPSNSLPKEPIIVTHSERVLKTLRAEQLISSGQPLINFSSCATKTVSHMTIIYAHHRVDGKLVKRQFPEGTKGFLYYRPGSTPIAGQVRLRICDSAAAFHHGHDLLVDGVWPWSIDLIKLVKNPRYQKFLDVAIRDGLITQNLVNDINRSTPLSQNQLANHPLYSISDPFYFDLTHQEQTLQLVTLDHVAKHRLYPPSLNLYPKPGDVDKLNPAFSGVVKLRFEMSAFRTHANLGPTLVLKVLEIVKPIHRLIPDGLGKAIKPVAGEYYHRLDAKDIPRMWKFPLKFPNRHQKFTPLIEQSNVIYAK